MTSPVQSVAVLDALRARLDRNEISHDVRHLFPTERDDRTGWLLPRQCDYNELWNGIGKNTINSAINIKGWPHLTATTNLQHFLLASSRSRLVVIDERQQISTDGKLMKRHDDILQCATNRVSSVHHVGSHVDMLITLLSKGALANLNVLVLSGNKIGDDGMKAISDVIKPTAQGGKGALAKLESLKLISNEIGDAGATALASACAKGLTSLTELDLMSNRIRDAGLTSLAEACGKGALANLTVLELSRNLIDKLGVAALTEVITPDKHGKRALPKLRLLSLTSWELWSARPRVAYPLLAQVCRERDILLN